MTLMVSDIRSAQASGSGLTMVELLVAVCLATVVLMGAWPWCWTMVRSGQRVSEEAEVSSSLAFAGRLFASEVRRASDLGDKDGKGCSASSVTLRLIDPATGKTEEVAYRYDPVRGVLWRKAPGSYVAEGLTSCDVSYFRADGSEVSPGVDGSVAADDLDSVRSLTLSVSIDFDHRSCERSWTVALRVWGR